MTMLAVFEAGSQVIGVKKIKLCSMFTKEF